MVNSSTSEPADSNSSATKFSNSAGVMSGGGYCAVGRATVDSSVTRIDGRRFALRCAAEQDSIDTQLVTQGDRFVPDQVVMRSRRVLAPGVYARWVLMACLRATRRSQGRHDLLCVLRGGIPVPFGGGCMAAGLPLPTFYGSITRH